MNTLADYSPGEILAAYTAAILLAVLVSAIVGGVIGVFIDRRRTRRAERLAGLPAPMRIPLPDRHRSVAPAASTCTEVRA